MDRSDGFTLVELLVLITIIVILLALLMPALDQAIYQAELAVCGANLKATANAASVYAVQYSQHYPYRAGVRQYGYRPTKLYRPAEGASGDLRP